MILQMRFKLIKERDNISSVQFSSVQLPSPVRLFVIPWIAAHQASLSITNSRSLPKLMSIESVMPSSHLILCRPLLLLPSVLPAKGLFQWVGSLHQVTKVLEFQLQHQSIQWIIRTDFHYQCGTFCWLSLSLCYKTLFHESPTFLHILRTEVLIVLSF